MADPVTLMAGASMAATAAGGIVGAFGSEYKGEAEANMWTYRAGVARLNKQIADQNATYALAVGETKAQQAGMASRFHLGQAKVAQAASGLDINTGSAVETRASIASLGEHDQASIRSDAAREAYGFKIKGMEAEAEAGLDEMAARNVRTAAHYDTISSILGAASSTGRNYLDFRRAGIFGA